MNMVVDHSSIETHKHYARIAESIEWLRENHIKQPSLKELSRAMSVSEFHLQRLFAEWAGVTPKQFLQVLTKEYAKHLLENHSVLDSAFASGLSNSSRLHDLFVTYEAVSPGEFKRGGQDIEIEYGSGSSPFGQVFIGFTHRGICKLSFYDQQQEYLELEKELEKEWPNALLTANHRKAAKTAERVFYHHANHQQPLKLLLKGSPFRIKVWEALLSIPEGKLATYGDIATKIGQPSASRAAASAIASNPIGYLIPCHRVIRQTGEINQYRWGQNRKTAMIGKELSSNL